MSRRSTHPWERLQRHIDVNDNGCWIFTGALSQGYGVLGVGRRGEGNIFAHRLAYEYLWGFIPASLHIDHLCMVRACCNPFHLEAVTQRVNNQRAQKANRRTHCPKGHEYTPENTGHTTRQRYCKTCRRESIRSLRAKKKASA